jgi:hypothetical protein
MKERKAFRAGWLCILMASLFFLASGTQAQDMDDIISELEGIKATADSLLNDVEPITNPALLPPLWDQALLLEEQALTVIQDGIDIAQSQPDPPELLKKKIIIFEKLHVKVITTITIIKITIIRIQEKYEGDPGIPEVPLIDYIKGLSNQLRDYKDSANALIAQVEAVTDSTQLPALWEDALALEEQILPIVQEGIDSAQTVPLPSHILEKKIIIFEKWHIKVIQVVVIAKLTIIQLQEELRLPTLPPEEVDIINELKDLADSLQNMESAADDLMDVIDTVTNPVDLQPLWDIALSLEEQSLPYITRGIDTAQTIFAPCEILRKKLIILEVWINVVVVDITINKLIIIQVREELEVPPGLPEPEIDAIAALTDSLKALDRDVESLIDHVRKTEFDDHLDYRWAEALEYEEEALQALQDGIDLAQGIVDPSELLQKEIIILEAWTVRVITEICIVKVLIIEGKEKGYPVSTEVPTLTEWGFIIFTVLLLGWMAWVIMRRRRTVKVGI